MNSGLSELEAQTETAWPSAEPSMWRERAQPTVSKGGWLGLALALWSPVTPTGLYSLSEPESLRSYTSNPVVLGRMGRSHDSTHVTRRKASGQPSAILGPDAHWASNRNRMDIRMTFPGEKMGHGKIEPS